MRLFGEVIRPHLEGVLHMFGNMLPGDDEAPFRRRAKHEIGAVRIEFGKKIVEQEHERLSPLFFKKIRGNEFERVKERLVLPSRKVVFRTDFS